MSQYPSNENVAAKGVPYFTPAQTPPAGTAIDPQPDGRPIPHVFQPIRIRGVTFQNRIWLSPLCQYSAENGKMTPWHMAHLGGIFTRGPGHTMIEATAVLPNGRITPEDVGIWSDDHIGYMSEIVTFAHSQSQKIGIQLAHAGRKASTVAPWISGDYTAREDVGGWPDDVVAPSPIRFADEYPHPKELATEGIKDIVEAFEVGAKRALKAGFDVIEIHAAHGYLLSEFLSPATNKRTDEYGGSFENRIRLLLEIAERIRAVIPETMPLFVRVSGTDWLEESLPDEPSWKSADTVHLAPILYKYGVDLLDVSSGGNHPMQKIKGGPAYQTWLAEAVMRGLETESAYPSAKFDTTAEDSRPPRLLVATVGAIRSGVLAEKQLKDGRADVVLVGRGFQKNPGIVWTFADELDNLEVKVANQIGWGFKGRGKKFLEGEEKDKRHDSLIQSILSNLINAWNAFYEKLL